MHELPITCTSRILIPIGIQYHYANPPWLKLDLLLSQMEVDCGLPVQRIGKSASEKHNDIFYQRLLGLGKYLIIQMEGLYHKHYNCDFPDAQLGDNTAEVLVSRLQYLLNEALNLCEQYFHIQTKGNIIDRCRRIEEVGWSHIYCQDTNEIKSPLNQGITDWIAHESAIRMRHMRLVESLVAVNANYIQEKPSIERFAEISLIIFDIIARIKGIKVPCRPRLGWRNSQVTIGKPISVTKSWLNYQQNSGDNYRRATKEVVNDITAKLKIALEEMIT